MSAYKVVLDDAICQKCGHGQTWTVRTPDGYRIAKSFDDEVDADEMAEMLNAAWELGRLSTPVR